MLLQQPLAGRCVVAGCLDALLKRGLAQLVLILAHEGLLLLHRRQLRRRLLLQLKLHLRSVHLLLHLELQLNGSHDGVLVLFGVCEQGLLLGDHLSVLNLEALLLARSQLLLEHFQLALLVHGLLLLQLINLPRVPIQQPLALCVTVRALELRQHLMVHHRRLLAVVHVDLHCQQLGLGHRGIIQRLLEHTRQI